MLYEDADQSGLVKEELPTAESCEATSSSLLYWKIRCVRLANSTAEQLHRTVTCLTTVRGAESSSITRRQVFGWPHNASRYVGVHGDDHYVLTVGETEASPDSAAAAATAAA